MGFPGGSVINNLAANAGDVGLIPGSGRSPGEGNGNPLQCSCLENPRDRGAWWAAVYGVAESQTRLRRLRSNSSSSKKGSQVALVVKNPPASARNVRDTGSIPVLGRSPGGGHGNPLQYSWAFLVAQRVKNPPVMWEA